VWEDEQAQIRKKLQQHGWQAMHADGKEQSKIDTEITK